MQLKDYGIGFQPIERSRKAGLKLVLELGLSVVRIKLQIVKKKCT